MAKVKTKDIKATLNSLFGMLIEAKKERDAAQARMLQISKAIRTVKGLNLELDK